MLDDIIRKSLELTKDPSQAAPILAGRYRIIRKLGQGGMGEVYLAEDTEMGNRLFAIKTLPTVLVGNRRAIEGLKKEAGVAMELSHPHIVTLRHFQESEGLAFLVMDYVTGRSLEDVLVERRILSEEEVLRIFGPVAEALDYAHGRKVVHRDIKPGNILLGEDGKGMLADFSIAQMVRETHTRVTGQPVSGALPYMSPEQLTGERPAPAQDIYSLAATLYECLTGDPPFARGDIQWQIVNKAPEPLESQSPLAQAIMSGLSKKPGERPKNAKRMLMGEASLPPVADAEGSGKGRQIRQERERVPGLASEAPKGKPAGESQIPISKLRVAFESGERGEFIRYVQEAEGKLQTDDDALCAIGLFDDVSPEYSRLLVKLLEMIGNGKMSGSIRVEAARRLAGLGGLETAKGMVESVLAEDRADRDAESLLREVFAARKALTEKPGRVPAGCRAGQSSGQEPYTGTGFCREVIHEKSGIELVWVPSGALAMGSQRVTIARGFYLGKLPVTEAQWRRFKREKGWLGSLRGEIQSNLPQTCLWSEAKAFCAWAGLRLPSEAEWEYACRAGTTTEYCFGNDKSRLGEYAWFDANSGGKEQPVGQKKPNDWGLYDVHGNVWEWCEDVWHDKLDGAPNNGSAWISGGDANRRVVRGGSWSNGPENCRSAARYGNSQDDRLVDSGFRVALGLP